jgi:hypothetical protein
MSTEERLPPTCAFAVSVLVERDIDPDAVPEEAVEAAQHHMSTCVRCVNAHALETLSHTTPRKKKKARRLAESEYGSHAISHRHADEPIPIISEQDSHILPIAPQPPAPQSAQRTALQIAAPVVALPAPPTTIPPLVSSSSETAADEPLDCQQCRKLLSEYAEAMDGGQNVATLYPEVHEHLLNCESGCLVLLDLFRQEAKATRKYRRRPVRDPFRVIGWQLTGFFRTGQIPVSPMALAYGTLLLLLLVASLSTYLGIRWDDARYYTAPRHLLPTPDGIGLSDGLHIYDACNSNSYRDKREAAQAMQAGDVSKADELLTIAMNAPATDTTGCNGAEAAIYREDLRVRLSGHPFGIVVASFDSGPGNADPQGGTDRHILYAAYTQELVGAFIAQQQYNAAQMQTPGVPLLYLVLANTAGIEQGTLQVANTISAIATTRDLHHAGLLAKDSHPLLAALGLGPSRLIQIALPVLCRAGVPLIAPTSTGIFIIDLLTQTSLYRHCTPGFAFIRFSPDDAHQSFLAASYAYRQLHVHNAAIFYDPSNPSSKGSAQAFSDNFSKYTHAQIVAQETAAASGLLDSSGRPQASREDLLMGFNDALQAKPRPDLIFAPLLTNDVIALGQAIAQLPRNQQPILMIGGEFVQPTALQGLVQWSRQQQLTLPRIFVSLSAAVRPPSNGDWQKQFYASFCTSFATPGSFCSGVAALDQGALFFADGIEILAKGVSSITDTSQFPTTSQLVQRISTEQFSGVSCPIALRLGYSVLVTSTKVQPVILGIQDDGSIQIVG